MTQPNHIDNDPLPVWGKPAQKTSEIASSSNISSGSAANMSLSISATTKYSKTAVVSAIADHELRLRAVERENQAIILANQELKKENDDWKAFVTKEFDGLKARLGRELKRKRAQQEEDDGEETEIESSDEEGLVSEQERSAIERSAAAAKSSAIKVSVAIYCVSVRICNPPQNDLPGASSVNIRTSYGSRRPHHEEHPSHLSC